MDTQGNSPGPFNVRGHRPKASGFEDVSGRASVVVEIGPAFARFRANGFADDA